MELNYHSSPEDSPNYFSSRPEPSTMSSASTTTSTHVLRAPVVAASAASLAAPARRAHAAPAAAAALLARFFKDWHCPFWTGSSAPARNNDTASAKLKLSSRRNGAVVAVLICQYNALLSYVNGGMATKLHGEIIILRSVRGN